MKSVFYFVNDKTHLLVIDDDKIQFGPGRDSHRFLKDDVIDVHNAGYKSISLQDISEITWKKKSNQIDFYDKAKSKSTIDISNSDKATEIIDFLKENIPALRSKKRRQIGVVVIFAIIVLATIIAWFLFTLNIALDYEQSNMIHIPDGFLGPITWEIARGGLIKTLLIFAAPILIVSVVIWMGFKKAEVTINLKQ